VDKTAHNQPRKPIRLNVCFGSIPAIRACGLRPAPLYVAQAIVLEFFFERRRGCCMISEASVRRAINHLGSFGDTDLFPRLPEMRCFLERPGTIAKDCERLNIGQYAPVSAIETLTPKSWLGFRIAHQLTAADNVIYLAALLDCAPNLESARLPKDDNEAFAYRFAEGAAITNGLLISPSSAVRSRRIGQRS
jgi:hypothetical protein